jgi:hypothetical protein
LGFCASILHVTAAETLSFLTLGIRKDVPDFIDTGEKQNMCHITAPLNILYGTFSPRLTHTIEIGLFPFTCENPETDSRQVLILFALEKDGLLRQHVSLAVLSETAHSRIG